ncbi:MAG: plasmid pRiA4b ORF-3 family protein [Phycisphaerales bacterium]|nr:MAG: plasmid pRiA4b ORF-3 family protein [Phycisphaerales bacterium]
MAKRKKPARGSTEQDKRLFTLEVSIIGGPVTEEFAKKTKVVSRTIQIRGDQTFEDLHYAIFDAFDREDEHMYEFQVGGKAPMDPKARRYTLESDIEMPFSGDEESAGDVVRTTIGSLGLEVGVAFGYWFDFGDDWWHEISVVDIEEKAGRGKYPKITKHVGESPPQYPDWDEEEE